MSWINDLDVAIRELLAWASTINPWWCVLGVLLVLVVETSLLVGLLVPGEAALLLSIGTLGASWTPPLLVVAVLASVLGQTGGYWLGRAAGPGIRRTWLGRKLGEQRWEAAESIVLGSGARALIMTRFMAFVHAVVPIVIGTLGLPFRRFLVLATVGAALWATVHISVAVALGGAAQLIGYGWVTVACTVFGTVAGAVILIRAIRRRRQSSLPSTMDSVALLS